MFVDARRTCPWCFGARTCRNCNGNGSAAMPASRESGPSDLCPVCKGTGHCAQCEGTGVAPPDESKLAGSLLHKLCRVAPGLAPGYLCPQHRLPGGSLLDLLTGTVVVVPLVIIPNVITAWSWLALLALPAAYLCSVGRRNFENAEWLARDALRPPRLSNQPADFDHTAHLRG